MATEQIQIRHAEKAHPLVPKKNLLVASGASGALLGSVSLHPYSDPDLEPDHPHNINLYIHPSQDRPLTEAVRDALLEGALARAVEIKKEKGGGPIRLYICFLAEQEQEIEYFLRRGYQHDASMLILERLLPGPLPGTGIPEDMTLRDDLIENGPDLERLLAAHSAVFPRHPYTREALEELKSCPGWLDLTLLAGEKIAGNIMLLADEQDPDAGWIEDLFISKPFRRRGAARFLMAQGLNHFWGLGLGKARLELWSANRAARSLYDRFDFHVSAETEIALSRIL